MSDSPPRRLGVPRQRVHALLEWEESPPLAASRNRSTRASPFGREPVTEGVRVGGDLRVATLRPCGRSAIRRRGSEPQPTGRLSRTVRTGMVRVAAAINDRRMARNGRHGERRREGEAR